MKNVANKKVLLVPSACDPFYMSMKIILNVIAPVTQAPIICSWAALAQFY
jgi:hypothetical protein